jgi:hypothetical protein
MPCEQRCTYGGAHPGRQPPSPALSACRQPPPGAPRAAAYRREHQIQFECAAAGGNVKSRGFVRTLGKWRSVPSPVSGIVCSPPDCAGTRTSCAPSPTGIRLRSRRCVAETTQPSPGRRSTERRARGPIKGLLGLWLRRLRATHGCRGDREKARSAKPASCGNFPCRTQRT